MRGRPLTRCAGTDFEPHYPMWLRIGDTCPLCLVIKRDPNAREKILSQGRDIQTRDELKEWNG
jgi:hypothetical protein